MEQDGDDHRRKEDHGKHKHRRKVMEQDGDDHRTKEDQEDHGEHKHRRRW